jgi:hypothetical protein
MLYGNTLTDTMIRPDRNDAYGFGIVGHGINCHIPAHGISPSILRGVICVIACIIQPGSSITVSII